MREFFVVLVVIILIGLGRMAAVVLPASGEFVELEPTGLEGCEPFEIAPGTEDVTIDPETGLAYVSAAERRGGSPEANGVYAFDPDDPAGTLRRVSTDAPSDFQPHGISLWRGPEGEARLFVVNHPDAGHTVEIFEVGSDGSLSHLETIAYPALESPNDVLAVGPRAFYATNDRGFTEGVMSMAEAYLGLPLASVTYFNGAQGRLLANGLVYANGVALGSNGERLYVAEFLGRRITVYQRDPDSGAITRIDRISVETGPDNIETGPEGDLWIGGHPRVFDFLDHADDAASIAPSQVIRLNPDTGETETVLAALDGEINASSVGAVDADTLIVGAVFDSHVLVCPR
ncbi:hypothetical protein DDZ18_08425 [Marinicauda salina]|uniref:Arylesterase n=1 Tax=Marinicauda salina TaxID=2135793 RepID=A0A2U2BUJ0_9PROT|nr:hypothetical protein [Marinicauda salina]PWE17673.1 hypothetical protein DDZ18_08425 [Marinicauda salina]